LLEYTSAFLNSFSWAKTAYQYYLNQDGNNNTVNISPGDLVSSVSATIPTTPIFIQTSSDWNSASNFFVTNLAGMYKSVDKANEYYNSLYTTLKGRLKESTQRVQDIESNLKVQSSNTKLLSSLSVDIKGGDFSSIDLNPIYYKQFEPLTAVPEEVISFMNNPKPLFLPEGSVASGVLSTKGKPV